MKEFEVNEIGLNVKEKDGEFFWSVEDFSDIDSDSNGCSWKEIPKSLYIELKKWHGAKEDMTVFRNTKRYVVKKK